MCPWNSLSTHELRTYPHGMECALAKLLILVPQSAPMKRVHVVFHDGGGGHRNAAVALQTVISQQQHDWQLQLVQFQDLTDRLDVLRKLTGIRIQQQYNIMLQNGWTLGSTQLLRVLQATIRVFHRPLVNLLKKFWMEKPADLLVSVIPHFNRQICESWTTVYPGRPFVTIITDLADFPPGFLRARRFRPRRAAPGNGFARRPCHGHRAFRRPRLKSDVRDHGKTGRRRTAVAANL